MNTLEFAKHRIRELEKNELAERLQASNLSREMAETILNRTVEVCIDAYSHEDFEIGDAFAALNGIAETRWREAAA